MSFVYCYYIGKMIQLLDMYCMDVNVQMKSLYCFFNGIVYILSYKFILLWQRGYSMIKVEDDSYRYIFL